MSIPPIAMVLAAGRGERMRPLTDHTPKPLLKVNGKPLLEWHLEALAAAGFTTVVINVAHLGAQIERFVGDGRQWGLKARFSFEPEGALETAGGIAQAQPWQYSKEASPETPFLVINADIWTDWPRQQAFQIAQTLQADRALAHIVLVDNPPQHPEGDFEFSAEGAQQRLTFSGIGMYRPQFFSGIQAGQRAALAPLLRKAIAAKECTSSHYRGKWSDIGTPDRLAAINNSFKDHERT